MRHARATRGLARSAVKGFTLIELLVVISIIALLSTIVFASVNVAQRKAADATIKGTLVQARAEADLFYGTQNHYEGVCAIDPNVQNAIGDQILLAETTYDNLTGFPGFSDGSASRWDNGQCHDSATAWAAIVPLKSSANGSIVAFCVDHTGSGKVVNAVLASNALTCP